MVISLNSEPHRQEFKKLLDLLVIELKHEAKKNPQKYKNLLGNRLERVTYEILCRLANGTPFDGSIELVSGQNFPDIIANKHYGLEVKTTKSNHWKSIGSSVAEGTRVEGIERIFMLFGKMNPPIEFRCRPYEECLASVVVTHSPRYTIDMTLGKGETFFDKIKIPYDKLRTKENPIEIILDYYRSQLKEGETTWWLTGGTKSKESNMVIRLWSSLTQKEADVLRAKGLLLFPEILSSKKDKYARMSLWLATIESVITSNLRDKYTAGGQEQLSFEGKHYAIPKIVKTLIDLLPLIKDQLELLNIEELQEYWPVKPCQSAESLYIQWSKLVAKEAESLTSFPLGRYLISVK
ncbi:hypothetical protein [Porphyromonas sp. COT-290 OH860]|uniref:hypothetical protein n=1 Tax=Porphyromonas sp. COT-290 OH860 TaxID=1515615 RepID=UPI00052BBAAD|nr:hypothetical protein [Porphyromonas sp. COT-290 OH860]KGN83949.1 hypothetical protein HQ41_05630 [Porphyromonas sp. COT-290 OH860]